MTFINGAIEKDFEVDGYETSWTNLEFTKSGGYQIDVSPVFNDSRNTKATSTTMYSARGNLGIFIRPYIKITYITIQRYSKVHLCEALNTNRKYLSKLISSYFRHSFLNFIEYVKKEENFHDAMMCLLNFVI